MKKLAVFIISACLASTSASVMARNVDRVSLMTLQSDVAMHIKDTGSFGDRSDIRNNTISERAFQVGAQYGYIDTIRKIQDKISIKENEIDRVYNFPYLMSMSTNNSAEMYLIPPIVQKYSDIKALDHKNNTLTVIKKKYAITEPARLVTTALDWRQYLTFIPEAVEVKVPESLLPKTDSEKETWARAVNEGWHEGSQLAEREMLSRFERLAHDFGGIIRFNRLADENYFTRPKLVETRTPVSGGGTQVIQNKTVYTIIADSSANIDEKQWEARVLDNRESMIFPKEYDSVDIKVRTR